MRHPALVLVVDDDRPLLARLGEVLRDCEMEPLLTGSVEEAIAALGGGVTPDAIVLDLDIRAPGALARLHGVPGVEEVPVLALGSRPTNPLYAGPVDAVILKPLAADDLRRRLVEICDPAPMQ
jgi:CheY-like chemotaxis protein